MFIPSAVLLLLEAVDLVRDDIELSAELGLEAIRKSEASLKPVEPWRFALPWRKRRGDATRIA